MPYNPKTHLYEVEENIIHDITGKPTESKCRNEATNKLIDAFVAKATEEQVKKQEEADRITEESDAIFNSADSVITALAEGKLELTDDNLVKISRIQGELEYRRNCLYGYIGLIKDAERSKQLLAEYKHIDAQLIALNKAKRKNKVK